ncbi:MAG: outer membrane beta-barrel protein [Sediminibacterium sp.]
MNRVILLIGLLSLSQLVFAQNNKDSIYFVKDTLKVGGFIIIREPSINTPQEKVLKEVDRWGNTVISYKRTSKKKNKNISTYWFDLELGFANYRDMTNYPQARAGSYLTTMRPGDPGVSEATTTLNTGRSSNVNFWIFMQRLNISKHVLNLKYGIGWEMYNFRYDSRISFRTSPQPMAFIDSIGFRKNKLFAQYLTIPLMININTRPSSNHGFIFSAGVSAGYLVASRNKQISSERRKQKYKGDLAMQPWRVAAIGEIGVGAFKIYGSYSLNQLQKDYTRMEQFPYTIGIRYNKW